MRIFFLWLVALAAGTRAVAAPPEAVTILRDAWGVPHLFTTGRGAAERGSYAEGYAQAEDRLFQMDILRRAATGRLAELLGPGDRSMFLRMDEVVRRDGFTAAERDTFFRRLSARNRRAVEAYRAGVNAYINRVTLDRTQLPIEFGGTPPAPWETGDTVAVAVLQTTVFGASGGQEVVNAALLADLLDRFPEAEARGIFDDLFWIDDPTAPTTIDSGDPCAPRALRALRCSDAPGPRRLARPLPRSGSERTDRDQVTRFADAQMALVRAHAASLRRAADVLRQEQGILGGLGAHRHASNAMVVGPALSASGHPLLLGGPQTGLTIPSFFWEIGLHGGGYEAAGVLPPIGPGVLIGRGRNFAVTITSGILDNIDTFVETLDPADPERYLYRGKSVPFVRRQEVFKVSGQADVTLDVRRTVHGPVFFLDREGGVAYSRRAAPRGQEMSSAATLVEIGFVHNLREFRHLADRVASSLNLHYADTAGNIAYFHRGTMPLRPRHTDPRLPLDGRGNMEWRGLVPPGRLPSVVNPRQGFITNWNNKPIAGWSAGEQRELWGVVDRVQVFVDGLEAARAAGRKLTTDDLKALMRKAATSDIFAARILPFLEDAIATLAEPPDAPRSAAVSRVRAWVDAGAPLVGVPDRSGFIPDPGAAIYTEFRSVAQKTLFADELGSGLRNMFYPARNDGNQEDDHGSLNSPDALFLRVLFSGGAVPGAPVPPGLLPVSRNYFDDVGTGTHHTRAEFLVAALGTALDNLTAGFGTADQTRWQMPALLASYMEQGVIGAFFGASVIEREDRGSFNVVAELADPPQVDIIVPPGESGTFTAAQTGAEPPHLRDQLPLYEAFQYRRQPFRAEELQPPVTSETIAVER